MLKRFTIVGIGIILFAGLAGCGGAVPQPTSTPTSQPILAGALPKITSVQLDRADVPRYESLELTLALTADFQNPFDLRQVSLDGVFRGPQGEVMKIPGFWDGEHSWRVRFTAPSEGRWDYQITVTDRNGISLPAEGSFQVSASPLHGWLQAGNWINPDYSGHYLVYQDGTPFYGLGHCDALNILVDGFSADKGVGLFDQMAAAGENYVVWWPLYGMSPIGGSYDQFAVQNLNTIDLILKDAQKKGIFLVFTIWDHPELRAAGHAWGVGRWEANGFSKLSDIDSFFTAAEPWAWQENLYRYMIARWGYSPAIGLWQTVSEINGTNAYDQTNPWHKKVNDYFAANDPYRHPTTASMSGDVDWPEGHKVMDAPQVHVYDFSNGDLKIDAVHAAQVLAHWTSLMWNSEDKPNWVGEFGVPGNVYYPELFHNALWAALANGAAMTPADWNGGDWGEMTPAMEGDIGRIKSFLGEMPLAAINPAPLKILSGDPKVRAWGMAGDSAGFIWAQDYSLEGKSIDIVRAGPGVRHGAQLELSGLAEGTYTILPFDPWKGSWLKSFEVFCAQDKVCKIPLPDFTADIALKMAKQ